jgi:hypothetical protein
MCPAVKKVACSRQQMYQSIEPGACANCVNVQRGEGGDQVGHNTASAVMSPKPVYVACKINSSRHRWRHMQPCSCGARY